MTRKKVQLAWINNKTARRISLRKRRLSLLKKVSELTTLCDVDACLIVYNPEETEPVVWPSDKVEVQRVVTKFFETPSMERERKMMNQETYLLCSDAKTQENLMKFQSRCREVQMNNLMHQMNQGCKRIDQLSVAEMDGIVWFLDEKMKNIKSRMEIFQPFSSQPAAAGQGSPPPQGFANDHGYSAEVGGDGSTSAETFVDSLLQD